MSVRRTVVGAVAVVAVLAAACTTDPVPGSPSSRPDPSLTPIPTLDAGLPDVVVGDVVQVVASNLLLGSGVVGDSAPRVGLADSNPVYVLEGPRVMNGVTSYLVASTYFHPDVEESEIAFGWIPAHTADGSPTLWRLDPECSAGPITVESLWGTNRAEPLACLGSRSFDFIAYPAPGCRTGQSERVGTPGWLNGNWVSSWLVAEPLPDGAGFGGYLEAWSRPGIVVPCTGQQRLEITAHYDDPASATCRTLIGDRNVVPALSVLLCRTHLVIEAVGG